ncbi:hypothetical protein NCS57_01228200 [Fusarium keratoplasticum]|uniref:Uncharacterized protein n=1 Tax=Fusarium keratoplasticum TaxID=1328300 RepID=A0ACC0QJE5_9HYPO|nr:hypothetical protein NCS57_01228200 [Fusarium keratoplasticum]KAI8654811.1 hypothetical protein NCS57_01228200 [Fusarium keratoplasticum]KAI8655658.1 hypothetical protein NCS55_01218500 [Fusarium keratoplasticum]
MGFGHSSIGSQPGSAHQPRLTAPYRAMSPSPSMNEVSQEEAQNPTMLSQYSIGSQHAQAPLTMTTISGDRLPIKVVDPCTPTETEDKDMEYEHGELLVLDTYIWAGEKKRNRDVLAWANTLGCNRFWTREQKKGFKQTVKDLKKFKPNQLSGHVSNNVNRRLAKLEIMQIRVMAGHDNSRLFHSLSEEKPRIQKTRQAQEEEERARRDQIRKETIESLIRCGVVRSRDVRALSCA